MVLICKILFLSVETKSLLTLSEHWLEVHCLTKGDCFQSSKPFKVSPDSQWLAVPGVGCPPDVV